MCPSEAASAPANADTLPPPGVAVGAATASRNGRASPTSFPSFAVIRGAPLSASASLFSNTCAGEKFSSCRKKSAAISMAFFGTNPTISLPTGFTP